MDPQAPPPPQQPPQAPYPYPYPVHPVPPPRGSGATVAIVLGVVGGAIVLVGVLAAVMIPAFMKSARKAKSTEAVINLRRLWDGARSYYENENFAHEPQFPDTPAVATQPTPGMCCAMPGHKCAPDPSLWMDPTWQALRFSVDDPHYYSYTYESSGRGRAAAFSVRANGDLDCDTTYSTFEMIGIVGDDGTLRPAGLFKDQDRE